MGHPTGQLQKVGHIHECIINELCANPRITQLELCNMFGYTPTWMSRVIGSDSFKARLAERREELLRPDVRQRLNDRMQTVVLQSMDVVQKKLNQPEVSAEMALQALGLASSAMNMTRPKVK